MAKFITTSAYSTSLVEANSAQFKRLFASITGYDIMIEQSRRDLASSNVLNISGKSEGSSSYLLPTYISKFIVLFERESCNNNK